MSFSRRKIFYVAFVLYWIFKE
ncbi:hypothetical protein RHECNPAF_430038 [Rhizobium etli CNPAF512]|nr:hypothetical protein RHECNPAF_430038 [Rhizobium etli CNPAF512]